MKHPSEDPRKKLEQAVASLRAEQPDRDAMNAAGDRVWQRISQLEDLAAPARQIETIRSCADVRELLPQHRAGRLSAARALLVESHLHDCVACRREAESTNEEIPTRCDKDKAAMEPSHAGGSVVRAGTRGCNLVPVRACYPACAQFY